MEEIKMKKDIEAGTLDYPYTMKDFLVGKKDMSFIELPNQRHIRTNQVNSLARALKAGRHFDAPFVVNKNNGTKTIRVIDGGHRTEALRKYFDAFPDAKVKLSMAVYSDLTPAEERRIYTKWNLGVKQSVDDFVWSHRVEIPQYENLLAELPVTVYGSTEKLKMRYVVDAYICSKKSPFTGGSSYGRLDWLEVMQNINYSDVESMKDTFDLMYLIFNPNKRQDFVKLSPFKCCNLKALYRLIYTNKVFLGTTYIKKRMTTVLYNKSILDQFRSGQCQRTVDAYNLYKQYLNRGVAKQFK